LRAFATDVAAFQELLALALRRAGADGAVAAGAPPGYGVAGPEPVATVRPRDEAAVVAAVGVAREHGWAVVARGGGTADRWGGPLCRGPVVVCDMTALRGVVAHAPGDLTVRVLPGTPLLDLDAALRPAGQFLPLWPPRAAGATVGGAVACGAAGPTQLLHGGPRDLVLGLRGVDGTGRVFAAGGRVVKNVSGLDVGKLLVGSFGTLAVLTEVCCRLRPRPPASLRQAGVWGDERAALAAARAILDGPFRPAGLVVEGGTCVAAFEGTAEEVADQAARLAGTWAGARPLPPREADGAWARACEPAAGLPASSALLRCEVPEGALADLLGALQGMPGVRRRLAWPGLGVAWAVLERRGGLAGAVAEVRAAAADAGGLAVVADAPAELRAAVDPFGDPAELRPWLAAVKRRFDPEGILAPGRFAGGL
jgi:glycolate oxidase FAD binding subunit